MFSFLERISARAVLWVVTLTGFAINYMVLININIAIVDMIPVRPDPCHRNSSCVNTTLQGIQGSPSSAYLEYATDQKNHEDGTTRFEWDEHEQNLILSAFYWSTWITQLPGGVLAQRFGTKRVFGYSQLLSVLLNFVLPLAGQWGFEGIFIIRILQGIFNGFTWPAMHTLIGQWVPPEERSKFVTAYLGSSLGAALVYPVCALLISWFNWEAVFHATGILGTIWFVAWWFLVFDTPRQHPRISYKERNYIDESLGESVERTVKLRTPWFAIFTSLQVWLNTLVQFGAIWGLFTSMTQSHTYFTFIHGFDVRMTGLLSGISHICRILFAVLFSVLADKLIKNKFMKPTHVRKLATFVGVVLSGLCMGGLAFMGNDWIGAVILLTVANALSGAVSSGALSSILDISPNFAGVVFGIVSTVSVFPGFISPVVVGFLTYENQTAAQWKTVFLIAAGIQLVVGFLFIAFSSSKLQTWNSPDFHVSVECTKMTKNGVGRNIERTRKL